MIGLTHAVATLCCILHNFFTAHALTLRYQSSLSEVLALHPSISTIGNINIVQGYNDSSIEVAYLPYLIKFTCGDYLPVNSIGYYDGVASISLAMEHLNTGNGSIVPEISGLDEKCPLRFTTKSFDTECQQIVAVDHVISLTDRGSVGQLFPTTILGASRSSISMPTAMISGLRDVPQISPVSTSSALDDKEQYKLFGRTIPNDDGTSIPALAKLNEWGVNHLAVLYIDDSYGNAFMKGLVSAAQQAATNLQIQTVNIVPDPDAEAIQSAVQQLAETQYTYFFGILFDSHIDQIMTEAYNQGIAGTGIHNWIFSDSMGSYLADRQYEAGSKLALAYRGTGVLTATGGISGMSQYDKLDRAMQSMKNDQDISYLESLFPIGYANNVTVNHTMVSRDDEFLSAPTFIAPFLYDAVVAIGLAACRLRAISDLFTGEELYQALKNTTFEGTSGSVVFDSESGTRDPNSAVFLLQNFVYDNEFETDGDMIRFKSIDTDIFRSGQWDSLVPYTFNDGTNDVSADLPPLVTDFNYLSVGLRVVGLVFYAIVFILAIGFGGWTYHHRKKHVVRSSQPLFLYMISAGTLLMGSSLIPLSVDLSMANQSGANVACMSIPWLLATGFTLTFSALFTKTYRVNQIMKNSRKFKRVKISPVDVMKPMFTLLLINFVILIVWTVVDPIELETVVVIDDPFMRTVESYGMCTSDHDLAFIAVLGIINVGSLLLALCQAYLARKVSTDLQESNYIFITMALILLVAFIAVPVVIISKENRTVSYFIRASVIFVICTSVLVLIYVPKWKAFNKRIKNQKLGLVRQRSSFSEDQGINILWSPKDQIEVEDQNKGLLEQNKGLLEQNEKLLKEIEKWKNSEEIKAQTGLSNINMLSVQDKVCES